jgi:hypothetical protein
MKKNEKLDTLRADIAQIFHAIEKLTRRVDAVVVPAPKKAKKVRKRVTVQARPVQPTLTDQDEDENAASVSS